MILQTKKIILLIIIFAFCTFAQISTSEIDSINSLSFDKMVANLRQSLNTYTLNLENARKINYKRGEGIALSKLAILHYLLGD